jgi:hypothetical protein
VKSDITHAWLERRSEQVATNPGFNILKVLLVAPEKVSPAYDAVARKATLQHHD